MFWAVLQGSQFIPSSAELPVRAAQCRAGILVGQGLLWPTSQREVLWDARGAGGKSCTSGISWVRTHVGFHSPNVSVCKEQAE